MAWPEDLLKRFKDGPAKSEASTGPTPDTTAPAVAPSPVGERVVKEWAQKQAAAPPSPEFNPAASGAVTPEAVQGYYEHEARMRGIGDERPGGGIVAGLPGESREAMPWDPKVGQGFQEAFERSRAKGGTANYDENVAYRNTEGRLGDEPSWVERAVAAPVGMVAGALDKTRTGVGNPMQIFDKSTPPLQSKLPKGGGLPGVGIGEAVAGVVPAVASTVKRKVEGAAENVAQRRVLGDNPIAAPVNALAETLGLDNIRRPTWLGGESESENAKKGIAEGIYSSFREGVKNFPDEALGMAKGILQTAYHAGEGAGAVLNRERDIGESIDTAADVAQGIVKGMGESMVKTVVDPRKSLEDQPVSTLLNAAMIANPFERAVKSAPAKREAAIVSLEEKAGGFTDGSVKMRSGQGAIGEPIPAGETVRPTLPELKGRRDAAQSELVGHQAEVNAAVEANEGAAAALKKTSDFVDMLEGQNTRRVANEADNLAKLKATPGATPEIVDALERKLADRFTAKMGRLRKWLEDSKADPKMTPARLQRRVAAAEKEMADLGERYLQIIEKRKARPGVTPAAVAKAEQTFTERAVYQSKRLTEWKGTLKTAREGAAFAADRAAKAQETYRVKMPEVVKTLDAVDKRITARNDWQTTLDVVAKIPRAVLTFGVGGSLDMATSLVRRAMRPNIGEIVPGSGPARWKWMARNRVVPPEVLALEREALTSQTRAALEYTDYLRALPEKARPLVSEALRQASEFDAIPVDDLFGVRPGIRYDAESGAFTNTVGDGGIAATVDDVRSRYRDLNAELQPLLDAEFKSAKTLGQRTEALDRLEAAKRQLGDAEKADLLAIEQTRLANLYGQDPYVKAQADHAEAMRLRLEGEDVPTWPQVYPPEAALRRWGKAAEKEIANLDPLKAGEQLQKLDAPGISRTLVHGRKGMNAEFIEGLIGRSNRIARHQFLEKLAKDKNFVLEPKEFKALDDAWRYRKGIETKGQFSEHSTGVVTDPTLEWPLAPNDHANWGSLAGKHVKESVYYDIANGVRAMEEAGTWYSGWLSKWKASRTIWNPITSLRNPATNALLFAPMAGMSLLDARNLPYYVQAMADVLAGDASPMFRRSKAAGTFEGGIRSDTPSTLEFDIAERSTPTSRADAATKRAALAPSDRAWDGWAQHLDSTFGASLREAYEAAKYAPGTRMVTGPIRGLLRMLEPPAAIDRGLLRRAVDADPITRERIGGGSVSDQPFAPVGMSATEAATIKDKVYEDALTRLQKTRAGQQYYRAWGEMTDTPGMLYELGDSVFRQAYFRKLLDTVDGADIEHGSKARGAFMDYENVSGMAKVLRAPFDPILTPDNVPSRGYKALHWLAGQPFIAYPARAIPTTWKWYAENPIQAQIWMQISDRLTDLSYLEAGLSPEERKVYEAAADRMGEIPLVELYPPGKTDDGKIGLVNLGLINPFQQYTPRIVEGGSVTSKALEYINQIRGGSPLDTAIRPLLENKARFTGQPVVSALDESDALGQMSDYIARNTLPIALDNYRLTGDPFNGPVRYDKTGAEVQTRVIPYREVDPRVQSLTAIARIGQDVLQGADERVVQMLKSKGTTLLTGFDDLDDRQQYQFAGEWDRQIRPKLAEYIASVKALPPSEDRADILVELLEARAEKDPIDFRRQLSRAFGRMRSRLLDAQTELRSQATPEKPPPVVERGPDSWWMGFE